jgi:hypothetical protein
MQDELFLDLLWSDPHEGRGLVASERGDGIVKFGSDTVRDFLRRSGCELLVRSHECPPGAKDATFCASYTFKRSFYQDRLGTNIGKALKTEWRFSFLRRAWACSRVRQASWWKDVHHLFCQQLLRVQGQPRSCYDL